MSIFVLYIFLFAFFVFRFFFQQEMVWCQYAVVKIIQDLLIKTFQINGRDALRTMSECFANMC